MIISPSKGHSSSKVCTGCPVLGAKDLKPVLDLGLQSIYAKLCVLKET